MAKYKPPQPQVSSSSISSRNPAERTHIVKSGISESQSQEDSFEKSTFVATFAHSTPLQTFRSYHKSFEEAQEAKDKQLGKSDSFLIISTVHQVDKKGKRTPSGYLCKQEKKNRPSAGASPFKRTGRGDQEESGIQVDDAETSSQPGDYAKEEITGQQFSGNELVESHRYKSFTQHTCEHTKERYFEGRVECSINLAKLHKNDIFVIYKKTAIKSYMEVKISVIPNMDHDEILWHDLHIEATLKGHLLTNVQSGITACELATTTEVDSGSGWAHCLGNKRRKFYTGQLNYYCHLMQAEDLSSCRRKDIGVGVQFALYLRDADQSNLDTEWDDETDLMVVKTA